MESVLSEHEARDRTRRDGRGLWLRWEKTKAFFGFNNKRGDILSQAETFHVVVKLSCLKDWSRRQPQASSLYVNRNI